MARRTVYGHTHGENGWPMVDAGSCTWVNVPGVNVELQIQNGQPLQILRAFAADYHAHVEPLRNPDSACWTATNSVSTSNHLSGTAVDLNWQGADGKTFRLYKPMHINFPPPKDQRVRELLEFYEGIIFHGQNWNIQDGMHFQLNGKTYKNPRTQSFIDRKISADGYSTYKRAAKPNDVPVAMKDELMGDKLYESVSLYKTPGNDRKYTLAELIQSIDGMTHRELVEDAALLGSIPDIDRIAQVAAGQGAYTDTYSINHARAFLVRLEKENPAALKAYLEAKGV